MRAMTLDDLLGARSLASQQAVTIAPDGRHVAYVLQGEGDRRIPLSVPSGGISQPAIGSRVQVIEVASARTLEVAPSGSTSWGPCWSPDGRRLAFYGAEEETGPVTLWMWEAGDASARPTGQVALAGRAFGHGHAAWSADGRSVCVVLAAETTGGGPRLRISSS